MCRSSRTTHVFLSVHRRKGFGSGWPLFGSTVLRGTTTFHHNIVQLLSVEYDREEMNLAFRFCLILLHNHTLPDS